MAARRNSGPRPRRLQGRRGHRRARASRATRRAETPLITLETEKATMDVPSTRGRRRSRSCMVRRAASVSEGDAPSRCVEAEDGGARPQPAATAARPSAPRCSRRRAAPPASAARPHRAGQRAPAGGQPAPGRADAGGGRAAPSTRAGFARRTPVPRVRRFARELGVDLARVSGTGPQGPHHRRTTSRRT